MPASRESHGQNIAHSAAVRRQQLRRPGAKTDLAQWIKSMRSRVESALKEDERQSRETEFEISLLRKRTLEADDSNAKAVYSEAFEQLGDVLYPGKRRSHEASPSPLHDRHKRVKHDSVSSVEGSLEEQSEIDDSDEDYFSAEEDVDVHPPKEQVSLRTDQQTDVPSLDAKDNLDQLYVNDIGVATITDKQPATYVPPNETVYRAEPSSDSDLVEIISSSEEEEEEEEEMTKEEEQEAEEEESEEVDADLIEEDIIDNGDELFEYEDRSDIETTEPVEVEYEDGSDMEAMEPIEVEYDAESDVVEEVSGEEGIDASHYGLESDLLDEQYNEYGEQSNAGDYDNNQFDYYQGLNDGHVELEQHIAETNDNLDPMFFQTNEEHPLVDVAFAAVSAVDNSTGHDEQIADATSHKETTNEPVIDIPPTPQPAEAELVESTNQAAEDISETRQELDIGETNNPIVEEPLTRDVSIEPSGLWDSAMQSTRVEAVEVTPEAEPNNLLHLTSANDINPFTNQSDADLLNALKVMSDKFAQNIQKQTVFYNFGDSVRLESKRDQEDRVKIYRALNDVSQISERFVENSGELVGDAMRLFDKSFLFSGTRKALVAEETKPAKISHVHQHEQPSQDQLADDTIALFSRSKLFGGSTNEPEPSKEVEELNFDHNEQQEEMDVVQDSSLPDMSHETDGTSTMEPITQQAKASQEVQHHEKRTLRSQQDTVTSSTKLPEPIATTPKQSPRKAASTKPARSLSPARKSKAAAKPQLAENKDAKDEKRSTKPAPSPVRHYNLRSSTIVTVNHTHDKESGEPLDLPHPNQIPEESTQNAPKRQKAGKSPQKSTSSPAKIAKNAKTDTATQIDETPTNKRKRQREAATTESSEGQGRGRQLRSGRTLDQEETESKDLPKSERSASATRVKRIKIVSNNETKEDTSKEPANDDTKSSLDETTPKEHSKGATKPAAKKKKSEPATKKANVSPSIKKRLRNRKVNLNK